MCRFIESLSLKDGRLLNLALHNLRMNTTRQHFFNMREWLDLSLHITVPEQYQQGWHKCRVVYSQHIEQVQITPYTPRQIHSLRLVESANIDYSYKYENRQALDELFALRGACDDVVIIKNGWLTDSSYSNLLLYDGVNWVTPSQPLLSGVQRAHLLHQHLITEDNISVERIAQYTHIKLINALLDLEHAPTIPIDHIVW